MISPAPPDVHTEPSPGCAGGRGLVEATDGTEDRIVYVIDDDTAVCDSIAMLLTASNIRVATFTNGGAFLQHYVPKRGDCLLLDASLPALAAARLLGELRQRDYLLPVVLMTEDAALVDAASHSHASAPRLLLKPFSERSLLGCVRACRIEPAAD